MTILIQLPRTIIDDVFYIPAGHTKEPRKLTHSDLTRRVGLAYAVYLHMRQFRVWVPLSERLTVFRRHVCHVLGSRSRTQMRRIAARRIIAEVQDHMLVGDLSVCEGESDTMRLLPLIANLDSSVAASAVILRSPWPARIRTAALVNFLPEALIKRDTMPLMGAFRRAVPAWSMFEPRLKASDGRTTDVARTGYSSHVNRSFRLAAPRPVTAGAWLSDAMNYTISATAAERIG